MTTSEIKTNASVAISKTLRISKSLTDKQAQSILDRHIQLSKESSFFDVAAALEIQRQIDFCYANRKN